MMHTNFERIVKKSTEGFTGRKGAKLNKRDRKASREEKREAFDRIADKSTRKYSKCGKQYRSEV